MIKTVLWDFDGVILDSMKVRDWGFEEIFKDFDQELIDKLLAYHRINGGLSRYVKIRYFFEELLGQSITEERVLEYAQKFSTLMRKELTNSKNLITDTVNFIKNNHQNYNFHIVSGSDQEELRFLNKELRIDQYFISIHGSPTPKKQLVATLLKKHDYSLVRTCLIGDSINDYEAAIENDISFYAFNNLSLKKISNNYISSFKSFKF
ncbi:HAD-IA family hydrolase [Flavobacteriales bacterium]|nr:HAD-IA family hydrolase [Flavobacteriales bacterium]